MTFPDLKLATCFSLLIFLVCLSLPVFSHQMKPIVVEIDTIGEGNVRLKWRLPDDFPKSEYPSFKLTPCDVFQKQSQRSQKLSFIKTNSAIGQRIYRCETLLGLHLVVQHRAGASVAARSTMTMVKGKIEVDGESISIAELLQPGVSELQLNRLREKRWRLNYLEQGVRHIAEGYDHLLFVFCLILLVGSLKKLLVTITGFTLAHSITLALVSFKLVLPPIAATEAVIALSIVFLASEVIGGKRQNLSFRYPVFVAVVIGLLHGFGFARALQTLGLPQEEIASSILLFNLGVEFGQLGFIAVILLFGMVLKLLLPAAKEGTHDTSLIGIPVTLHKPCAYFIGLIAVYWFCERLLS